MRETAANNPLKIQTSSVFPVLHPCRSQIHSAEKYHESPFKVKRSSAPTAVLPEREQAVFRHSLALVGRKSRFPRFRYSWGAVIPAQAGIQYRNREIPPAQEQHSPRFQTLTEHQVEKSRESEVIGCRRTIAAS
jgi:hypothetical protein